MVSFLLVSVCVKSVNFCNPIALYCDIKGLSLFSNEIRVVSKLPPATLLI